MKKALIPIKEVIGSKKSSGTLFPKRLVVNDFEILAEKCFKFFSELGPKFKLIKKSSGSGETSSVITTHTSPSVFKRMRYIFNLFIEKKTFPNQLKIPEVAPLFKTAIMH